MNVDTMRQIDKHMGIPLCFIMNLIYKIAGLFNSLKRPAPHNALFIELSEMGSAIIADPAMRRLASEGVNLHFVIFKSNADSLRLLNTIPEQNIFTLRADNLFTLIFDSLKFIVWCRKKKIDTVIDLELFSRVTSLLSSVTGAANRVGFHAGYEEGLYRGSFQTHPVAYNPHQHISHNFMALIHALLEKDYKGPYPKTMIQEGDITLAQRDCSEQELEIVKTKISSLYPDYQPEKHRIVLINPNASDLLPQRRWMPERFAAVMSELLGRYDDILLVITGAPGEKKGADALCQQVNHSRCVNSAGVFRFLELPALYTISTTMLTNDSGPAHFASVTTLPTYVIFGPETPRLYSALGNSTPIYAGLACSPCVSASNHRKTSCLDNKCLQAIMPAQVVALMEKTLGKGKGEPRLISTQQLA